MHNFKALLRGEFMRMTRYKILQISFAVSLLWIVVLYMIGEENAAMFLVLFIFVDAAMMSIVMIGANLFFERQENTLKPLLITPSSLSSIIASKVISSVYLAIQSAIIVSLFAVFMLSIDVRFLLMIIFVGLIGLLHAMIGYVMAIFSKDFTGMLAGMIAYMFIFAIPTMLYALGVFSETFRLILMFSPSQASLILLEFVYGIEPFGIEIIICVIYLSVLSILIGKFIVFPRYVEKAVKE